MYVTVWYVVLYVYAWYCIVLYYCVYMHGTVLCVCVCKCPKGEICVCKHVSVTVIGLSSYCWLFSSFELIVAGDSPPPSDISSWFKSEGWGRSADKSVIIPHDIFVVGTQVIFVPPWVGLTPSVGGTNSLPGWD